MRAIVEPFSRQSPLSFTHGRRPAKASRRRRSAHLGLLAEPLEERRLLSVNLDGLDSSHCGPFLTYSQGGYGGDNIKAAPVAYLNAHFEAAFPDGLQIGDQAANAANGLDTTDGHRAALFES